MRRTRVIPVLLIHQGGVYKTTKFNKPIYIGDPINAIRLFNDMEVDEIAVLDIDASKHNRGPNFEMIEMLASEAFMPFAYGGGISTTSQAGAVLRCGIEKIILNHAIQDNTALISKCAGEIGSQSIVASIDYKKTIFGGIKCFDHVVGQTIDSKSVVDFAHDAEKAGAGEILLNSVDRDGTMSGLDVKLLEAIAASINVPIIACGGAGKLEHLSEAEQCGASAIAAGSMFVFHGKQRGVLISYPSETNLRKYLK